MPDFTARETTAEFNMARAAEPTMPQKTVTLQLDADLVAWFQAQEMRGGIAWQNDMNGVLRFYMETAEIREADFAATMNEPEPAASP